MKFTPACFQCQVEFLSRTLLSSFSWYIRSNCKKIGRLHYFSSVFLFLQAAFRAARCCIFFIRFELLLFHLRNLCILSLLQMRSACWIISLTRKNTIQNSKKLEENTHSPPPQNQKTLETLLDGPRIVVLFVSLFLFCILDYITLSV